MKKLFTFVVAMILTCSMITVSAAVPGAISKIYDNYTCDYRITMSFESGEDIVALLEETGTLEEMERYVDTKALLESLMKQDVKMNLQIDMSEDLRKIEMGLTADSAYNINVNKNLIMDVNAKYGMWMKLDLTSEEPVFEVIYTHPFLNKYAFVDVFELLTEEEKEELLDILNSVFNRENMVKMQEYSVGLIEKYASIKLKGNSCTVKIDNDAYTSMMDDCVNYFYEQMQGYSMDEEIVAVDEQTPSYKGMQLLGEDGITINYSMALGNITSMSMNADIDINLSEIYDEEWEYESDGILKFNVQCDAVMSEISKTKVDFPLLTDENSFDYFETHYEEYYYEEEYEWNYPHYWTGGYTDYLPVIDDEIYVPLRQTITDAYDDTANIDYNNGVITLTSEYLDEIKLTIDSDVAYVGGTARKIHRVVKINNVTYVASSDIEDIFGWWFSSAEYDMLENMYYYNFYTTE